MLVQAIASSGKRPERRLGQKSIICTHDPAVGAEQTGVGNFEYEVVRQVFVQTGIYGNRDTPDAKEGRE